MSGNTYACYKTLTIFFTNAYLLNDRYLYLHLYEKKEPQHKMKMSLNLTFSIQVFRRQYFLIPLKSGIEGLHETIRHQFSLPQKPGGQPALKNARQTRCRTRLAIITGIVHYLGALSGQSAPILTVEWITCPPASPRISILSLRLMRPGGSAFPRQIER